MKDDLFPGYKQVKEALMSLLHFNGGEMKALETYEILADYFGLSARARSISRGEYYEGKPHPQSAWQNRIQFGRRALRDAEYLDLSAPRGIWRLNAQGMYVAAGLCDDYYELHPSRRLTRENENEVTGPTPLALDFGDFVIPPSVKVTIYRVLRDTAIARRVKSLNNHVCQRCEAPALVLSDGKHYAEAHHIFPLSQGGPDVEANVLCVCPNCHALLDYEAVCIDLSSLKTQHPINPGFVKRHNDRVRRRTVEGLQYD